MLRSTLPALLLLLALMLPGCSPLTFHIGPAPGDRELQPTTVLSDPGVRNPRVAMVDVSGLLYNAERPALLEQGENPLSLLYEQLEMAASDDRVEALVVRINSPGGTVTASDAMYREIHRFRDTTRLPVVVLMMDVAASGGYYVACAGDLLVAHPSTITGSIGVLVQTVSVKPALSRLGIQSEAFVSGDNKAAGSPLTTLSDSHREVFETLVDDFYSQFVDVVRNARPGIEEERFAAVTDGRIMSGTEAHRQGLVDELGDLHTAFASAKKLAGIEAADLVRYHRPMRYVGSPYAMAEHRSGEAVGTQVNLFQLNLDRLPEMGSTAGVYYLWRPDLP